MTTTQNDTTRPPGFDEALAAYYPSLRKQAYYMAREIDAAEELLQETVSAMMRRASSCRVETFRTWAQWVLKSTKAQIKKGERRFMRAGKTVSISVFDDGNKSLENSCQQLRTLPNQHHAAELSEVMRMLPEIRDGDILLRRAQGEHLLDIGADLSVTRERVRQRETAALKVLRKRMRVAA